MEFRKSSYFIVETRLLSYSYTTISLNTNITVRQDFVPELRSHDLFVWVLRYIDTSSALYRSTVSKAEFMLQTHAIFDFPVDTSETIKIWLQK